MYIIYVLNLLLGQLLLGGFPLLDAVWDVDRDGLGAKVSATDVARHWHLPLKTSSPSCYFDSVPLELKRVSLVISCLVSR